MTSSIHDTHAACAGCALHGQSSTHRGETHEGRRRVLLLMGAGTLLAACSADDGNHGNDSGSSGTDGTSSGNDTGGLGQDTGGSPPDTGSTPPDSGNTPPDTGMTACTPLSESLGAVTDFPAGSYHLLPNADGGNGVIVGHDAGGLYCMTAVCTHQGCQVNAPNVSTGAISCPCHHARYTANGVPTSVAPDPLAHFALVLCNGELSCDTSTTVGASVRIPAA